MTDDLVDALFEDVYYPGSKKKRSEPKVKEPAIKANSEYQPRNILLPSGKLIEMFTIGALAEALNRPIITLRLWVKKNYLPNSPYQLPLVVGKDGKEYPGKKLYSRRMIEAAVEVFTRFGVLHVKRIDWVNNSKITTEITRVWNEILDDEMDTKHAK
jgi:hypothetical protein